MVGHRFIFDCNPLIILIHVNLSEIWNLGNHYRKTLESYVARGYKDVRATAQGPPSTDGDEPSAKKLKQNGDQTNYENIVFIRTNYNDSKCPDSVSLWTCRLNGKISLNYSK